MLTETKLKLLQSMQEACDEDKNRYSLLTLPDITPLAKEALETLVNAFTAKTGENPFRLLSFRVEEPHVDKIKRVKRLRIVYSSDEDNFFFLEMAKYVKYITKKIAQRDLKKHKDPLARKMFSLLSKYDLEGRRITVALCHATVSKATAELLKELVQLPLLKRVSFDVQFGVYNKGPDEMDKEFAALGLDEVSLIESFCKLKFEKLDFESMMDTENSAFCFSIDSYTNFNIDITSWDGTRMKASTGDDITPEEITKAAKICMSLLLTECEGTRVARWGYFRYRFNNYLGIFKKFVKEYDQERWMAVHYCVDSASCGGFVFSVTSWSASTLARLWKRTTPNARMQILRANLDDGDDSGDWSQKLWRTVYPVSHYGRKFPSPNGGFEMSDSEVSDLDPVGSENESENKSEGEESKKNGDEDDNEIERSTKRSKNVRTPPSEECK